MNTPPLRIEPRLIDDIMRRVAEQQSVDGLVETLESFVASLTSHASSSATCLGTPSTTLSCIAAQKVGLEKDRLYTIVYPDAIFYIFSRPAVADSLIEAPWVQSTGFDSQYVYLRTSTGVFVTSFRSLAQLWNQLNPNCFFQLYRSLWINRQKMAEIDDTEAKRKRVRVALSAGTKEWLTVSRRSFQTLRRQTGLRFRTPMREDGEDV